jgi:hypothetical protein
MNDTVETSETRDPRDEEIRNLKEAMHQRLQIIMVAVGSSVVMLLIMAKTLYGACPCAS